MLDHNVGAGANFNRIDTEDVGHDLKVPRIADLEQRRTRLDHGLAFLHDPQHHARYRRGDVPAFDWRVRTILVAGEQGLRLIDLVARRMILEFRGPKIAIGDPLFRPYPSPATGPAR